MKLKELEKRLKQEPDNLGLRVQVAGLLREAGRSVEAVEHYRSVALAYRDQGRTQQAIAVCRSILEIAPDDAACQGLIAMLQGRGTPSRPPAIRERPPQPAAAEQTTPALPGKPSASMARVSSLHPMKPPAVVSESKRRASLDETPLPRPIPYHVSDPTSRPTKLSPEELDLPPVEGADTRPGAEERPATTGLAQAARRISGLITESRGMPQEMDLSAELDTRQRPKVASEQLRKLERIPETPSFGRVDLDDLTTPPPDADDPDTSRVHLVTPPPRGSDDALTPPLRGNDALTPPPRGSEEELTRPRDRPEPDDD